MTPTPEVAVEAAGQAPDPIATAAAMPPEAASRRWAARLYERLGVASALIVLVAVMAIIAPNFFTTDNFLDVARQISVTAILAAGATFVILTAGIDLSVGSAVAVTAMVAVGLGRNGSPTIVALPCALAVGALIGLINGALVARLKLAAFIVTLAALTYLRGMAYVGTGGKTLFSTTLPFADLGQGTIFGIPIPVWIMAAVFAIGWFLLNRTVFGRHVLAVGGNEEAARLSGIPVARVIIGVYVISGVCAGIAGIISGARLQAAIPDLGTGYELNAIAAVVLGGTSLMGGRGSLSGTLVGAMIIGVLANGLTLLNVQSFYQLIIQGAVILLAVGLDRLRQKG
jgi:ribose transport system permease protein